MAQQQHERQRGGVPPAQRLQVLQALLNAARLGEVPTRHIMPGWWGTWGGASAGLGGRRLKKWQRHMLVNFKTSPQIDTAASSADSKATCEALVSEKGGAGKGEGFTLACSSQGVSVRFEARHRQP